MTALRINVYTHTHSIARVYLGGVHRRIKALRVNGVGYLELQSIFIYIPIVAPTEASICERAAIYRYIYKASSRAYNIIPAPVISIPRVALGYALFFLPSLSLPFSATPFYIHIFFTPAHQQQQQRNETALVPRNAALYIRASQKAKGAFSPLQFNPAITERPSAPYISSWQ